MDTQQTIMEINQPISFKKLQHIYTCSDDFLVKDKNVQQCLKGCKW